MPNTVPNQRLVAIHRERASSDFLGIKNSHWQAAARDLGAHALMLYLYFASNANGFLLALSPAAIRQAVGMPSSHTATNLCGWWIRAILSSAGTAILMISMKHHSAPRIQRKTKRTAAMTLRQTLLERRKPKTMTRQRIEK